MLLKNVDKLLVEVSEHVCIALLGSSESYYERLQSSLCHRADLTLQHERTSFIGSTAADL
jgi:hypothetical protein